MIKVNIVIREEVPIVVGGYYFVKAAGYHGFEERTLVRVVEKIPKNYSCSYGCLDERSNLYQHIEENDILRFSQIRNYDKD